VESLRYLYLSRLPYHTSLEKVISWITTLEDMEVSREIIRKMLREEPEDRPSLASQSVFFSSGEKNIIDLECPHDHNGPDPFAIEIEERISLELPADLEEKHFTRPYGPP